MGQLHRSTAGNLPLAEVKISHVSARAYRIPTASPESDGTATWDTTTLVIAFVTAGNREGIGYSYASGAATSIVKDTLRPVLMGKNALDIPECWNAMCVSVRNLGRSGVAACAISAVDNALWDVKAKLLGVPMIALLGAARESVPAYGSGGFTSYGPKEIKKQMEEWKRQGIRLFKIKIGRDGEEDVARIRAAVEALPEDGELFVDANGAYHPRQALIMAENMAKDNIAWFEEPVSSDDTEGLRHVKDRAPACMDIAAGEYGYNADDFRRLLENEAVDVLQADATRCLGLTGFLQAATLCDAHHRPLSSHCAPALHAAVMCHAQRALHIEYFYDHARIEKMLFDGVPKIKDGTIAPQSESPGFGFIFREKDAEKYEV